MNKLIRVTTVPVSLEKLLEGQLNYMQQEYEVIAVSSESLKLNELGKKIGVRTHSIEMTREITPIKDLLSLWRLFLFFKKEKPLIVHSHTPKAGIAGMVAAKLAGVPLRLHTVAGLPLLEAKGIKRRILVFVEKITFASATNIYPNSRRIYEYLNMNNFTYEKKLKVIGKGSSNGIDTSYFDPSQYSDEDKIAKRKFLGIPVNDLVFVFVGRLVTDKGINELVEAFKLINEDFPNTTLLLVGAFETKLDPLKPETIDLMTNHSKIIEAGYQDDVRPFLATADVLTFPSYREGFPNVVMQAGAMELASIVTNINGCNEIVQDGFNGLLIPVRETKALRDAMEKMIIDEEFRNFLGGNSRTLIIKDYERREIWKALLTEYKKLEVQFKNKIN